MLTNVGHGQQQIRKRVALSKCHAEPGLPCVLPAWGLPSSSTAVAAKLLWEQREQTWHTDRAGLQAAVGGLGSMDLGQSPRPSCPRASWDLGAVCEPKGSTGQPLSTGALAPEPLGSNQDFATW